MLSLESVWLKKIRFLYQILLISLSLNVGLILAVTYKKIKKTVKTRQQNKSLRVVQPSKLAVIEACFDLSFDELVNLLGSKEHIEDGLSYRDIALACLISFHDFAIDKVYLANFFEKRELVIYKAATSERVKMEVILGLDDEAFDSIQSFAKKEHFPVTLRGLFFLLKDPNKCDCADQISRQIYIQEPFCALYSLIKKLYPKLEKQLLLQLIVSGPYELFKEFSNKALEIHENERQVCFSYLKKYLMHQSKIVCYLLMKMDCDYCVHQLDQCEMLQFIALLDKASLENVIALKRILCSVRSSEIHETAARKLYEFSHEKMLEPYDHKKALKKFLPTFYSRNLHANTKDS